MRWGVSGKFSGLVLILLTAQINHLARDNRTDIFEMIQYNASNCSEVFIELHHSIMKYRQKQKQKLVTGQSIREESVNSTRIRDELGEIFSFLKLLENKGTTLGIRAGSKDLAEEDEGVEESEEESEEEKESVPKQQTLLIKSYS